MILEPEFFQFMKTNVKQGVKLRRNMKVGTTNLIYVVEIEKLETLWEMPPKLLQPEQYSFLQTRVTRNQESSKNVIYYENVLLLTKINYFDDENNVATIETHDIETEDEYFLIDTALFGNNSNDGNGWIFDDPQLNTDFLKVLNNPENVISLVDIKGTEIPTYDINNKTVVINRKVVTNRKYNPVTHGSVETFTNKPKSTVQLKTHDLRLKIELPDNLITASFYGNLEQDQLYFMKIFREPNHNNKIVDSFYYHEHYPSSFPGFLMYVVKCPTPPDNLYYLYFIGHGISTYTESKLKLISDDYAKSLKQNFDNTEFITKIEYGNLEDFDNLTIVYKKYYKNLLTTLKQKTQESNHYRISNLEEELLDSMSLDSEAVFVYHELHKRWGKDVPNTIFKTADFKLTNVKVPNEDELNIVFHNLVRLMFARIDTLHDFHSSKFVGSILKYLDSENSLLNYTNLLKKLKFLLESKNIPNIEVLINKYIPYILNRGHWRNVLQKRDEDVQAEISRYEKRCIYILEQLYNLYISDVTYAIGSEYNYGDIFGFDNDTGEQHDTSNDSIDVDNLPPVFNLGLDLVRIKSIYGDKVIFHVDSLSGSFITKYKTNQLLLNNKPINYQCSVVNKWDPSSVSCDITGKVEFPNQDIRKELDYVLFSSIFDKTLFKVKYENKTFQCDINQDHMNKLVKDNNNDSSPGKVPRDINTLTDCINNGLFPFMDEQTISKNDKALLAFDLKRSGDSFQVIEANYLNRLDKINVHVILTPDSLFHFQCRLLQVPCIYVRSGLYFAPLYIKDKKIPNNDIISGPDTKYIPGRIFQDNTIDMNEITSLLGNTGSTHGPSSPGPSSSPSPSSPPGPSSSSGPSSSEPSSSGLSVYPGPSSSEKGVKRQASDNIDTRPEKFPKNDIIKDICKRGQFLISISEFLISNKQEPFKNIITFEDQSINLQKFEIYLGQQNFNTQYEEINTVIRNEILRYTKIEVAFWNAFLLTVNEHIIQNDIHTILQTSKIASVKKINEEDSYKSLDHTILKRIQNMYIELLQKYEGFGNSVTTHGNIFNTIVKKQERQPNYEHTEYFSLAVTMANGELSSLYKAYEETRSPQNEGVTVVSLKSFLIPNGINKALEDILRTVKQKFFNYLMLRFQMSMSFVVPIECVVFEKLSTILQTQIHNQLGGVSLTVEDIHEIYCNPYDYKDFDFNKLLNYVYVPKIYRTYRSLNKVSFNNIEERVIDIHEIINFFVTMTTDGVDIISEFLIEEFKQEKELQDFDNAASDYSGNANSDDESEISDDPDPEVLKGGFKQMKLSDYHAKYYPVYSKLYYKN